MRYLLMTIVLITSSCSIGQWNEKLSTPEDRKVAGQTIKMFRAGNIVGLQPLMQKQLFEDTRKISKDDLKALVAPGDTELVTVNSSSVTTAGKTVTTKRLNYEYGSGSRWLLFQVALQETDDRPIVVGWYATPYDVKPTSAGDFNFEAKSAIHYGVITAMVVSTGIVFFAVIAAIKSKGLKRRWLWILGCLLGIGKFSLNWTTGEWGAQPVSILFFGSAVIKASPFDAWVLSFSIPVVALVFLWKRHRLLSNTPND